MYTTTTLGSEAKYFCDDRPGVTILTRVCEDDGIWSGIRAICIREPGGLTTQQTIGLAVGLSVGGALLIVGVVIIIAIIVVKKRLHYQKYVMPYKDYVKPFSVYGEQCS